MAYTANLTGQKQWRRLDSPNGVAGGCSVAPVADLFSKKKYQMLVPVPDGAGKRLPEQMQDEQIPALCLCAEGAVGPQPLSRSTKEEPQRRPPAGPTGAGAQRPRPRRGTRRGGRSFRPDGVTKPQRGPNCCTAAIARGQLRVWSLPHSQRSQEQEWGISHKTLLGGNWMSSFGSANKTNLKQIYKNHPFCEIDCSLCPIFIQPESN